MFHILPWANAGKMFESSGKIGIIGITAALGKVRERNMVLIDIDKVACVCDSDFS